LGESYNSESAPEVRLGPGDENTHGGADTGSDEGEGIGRSVPGTEFFEQALTLLQVRHEDPSIDQVEALNLAVRLSHESALSIN
jgi:hypothetical protein